MDGTQLDRFAEELAGHGAADILDAAAERFHGRVAFASSLGLEDQVITHMIAKNRLAIPIFTLDTGRLYDESYELIARTESRYGLRMRVLAPDGSAVEEMVALHGVNLFRDSVAARKRCCEVRKLAPLRRALDGLDAWVCGLRREQSVTREGVAAVEWDEANGLLKINPLHDWDEEQVREFIRLNDIPYNPLHDAGMPSIGCAPCTRAIRTGENIRAGRWWWEDPEHRECGLHSAGSPEPLRSLSSPPLAAAGAPCGVPATRPDDDGDSR